MGVTGFCCEEIERDQLVTASEHFNHPVTPEIRKDVPIDLNDALELKVVTNADVHSDLSISEAIKSDAEPSKRAGVNHPFISAQLMAQKIDKHVLEENGHCLIDDVHVVVVVEDVLQLFFVDLEIVFNLTVFHYSISLRDL